ncbi:MAG: aminotransferase class I/II-fold pyridoxal phosphate-dependent enzyme [Planctomycetes bacterium]|nr:aminotransferase class I/II-fold pyridoxal phosphate-dependent enzyme [Planctomycetota bacterium]
MRDPVTATRLRSFGTTIFTEMTRLANQHHAVNLAQGFPDFAGPQFAKDAAVRAIGEDRNQYGRMQGEVPLVEAIAASLHARHGLTYDPMTEIVVTSGATEAIAATILALVEPGDEVVVLEPYYDSYRACISMAGGVPRFVTLRAPDFRWAPGAVAAAFSPRTRMVLVNTPHNPTGRVLTRAEMTEIAAQCVAHDAICVTDEVYDRLVFDGEHVAMATLPGMRERTISINSTGKTFSVTGWKVGWAAAPAALAKAVATAHQFLTFAVATPFQHAAAEALRTATTYYDDFLRDYRGRRDFLVGALRDAGFAVTVPEGTYFVMADIRPLGWDDDVAFCRHLVEEIGVAAIPPTAFYENKAEGRFLTRWAFCKRDETLRTGVERLSKLRRR